VLVSLGGERVGVELVGGQSAPGNESAPCRLDHDWYAAGIDLMCRKVGQVGHHGLMDEARAAQKSARETIKK